MKFNNTLCLALVCMWDCLHTLSSFRFQFKKVKCAKYISRSATDIIKITTAPGRRTFASFLEGSNSQNELVIEGMPNKNRFQEYYKKTVSTANLMTKDKFIQCDQVQKMLNESLLFPEDIDELWISAIGDSAGLDSDEAYEMLCMCFDIPDPEDVQYLDSEFKSLTKSKPELGFSKFIMWQDIQDILNDEALDMEEITELWRSIAGDLNTAIKLEGFRKLNHLLDMKLEEDSDTNNIPAKDVKIVDPFSFFDLDTLSEFKLYFESQMNSGRQIAFDSISNWSDIRDMIADGVVSANDVKLSFDEVSKGSNAISYDDFLVFNVRVDQMMKDDVTTETEKSKYESQSFYKNEFRNMMGTSSLMPIEVLLDWKEIVELIEDDVISEKQIETVFNSLAEPIGIPATSVGISIDSFVKFNQIIDSSMQSDTSNTSNNNSKTLVAFNSLPESAQNELLKPKASESTATIEELELMKMLDSADNLLNSGSFGDYSSLIGDDASLVDKELLKSCDSVAGSSNVQDDLNSLVQYSNKIQNCGLEASEADAAVLFDLFQRVLAKSTPLVKYEIGDLKMKLNGTWKLLYTNSEMFKFYGGLTGFNNVFPATKFSELSIQYSTDGFLNELKYLESLTNPFGKLLATVFGTWDLIKETSFMTNQISVVMRSFCTKVTAGIATYEAQENWKSLRTLSMNELLYIDDNVLLMRNCGALKIFFVLIKTES